METEKSATGLFLLCCVVTLVYSEVNVSYIGQKLFEVDHTATFECLINPKPETIDGFEVTWRKTSSTQSRIIGKITQDGPILFGSAPQNLGSRFIMSESDFAIGRAVSKILNVTVADEGFYTCEVEVVDSGNVHLQNSDSFGINVYKPPSVSIEILKKKINLLPLTESEALNNNTIDRLTTEKNLSQIARCHVIGAYPVPSRVTFDITELKTWTVLEPSFLSNEKNADGTFNITAMLEIKPISDLDEKRVICQAFLTEQDIMAESDFSKQLEVLYETTRVNIQIEPPQWSVNRGEFSMITCEANGNPSPTITLNLPSGRKVDLTQTGYDFQIDSSDAGAYSCSATNFGEKLVSSSKKKLRVLWLDDPIIEGPENVYSGDDVTLKCNVDHSSKLVYAWHKDSNSDQTLSTNNVLIINQVEASDAGHYTCTVIASGETKIASYHMDVLANCNPYIIKDIASSQYVSGEAYVMLTCYGQGNPGCDMEMTSYKDITAVTRKNHASLVIKSLPKQTNPLEFTCTAKNHLGTESVSVKLDHSMAYNPEPTTGGMSAGLVVLLIIVLAFFIVGVPLVYCIKKRKSPTTFKSDNGEDVEKKLNVEENLP